MSSKKRLKALGAYIFAGGFTIGVREHFDVLAHFEDGPYGVETALHNKLVPEVFTSPDEWPAEKFKGKVDFLYANPPCAPWSMASSGRPTHWTEDPRVNAVRRLSKLLHDVRPTVWAWESVRPAWVKGRMLVEAVAADAAKLGYSATVLMVDGSLHGVPQARKRFFLVLSKVPIDWQPSGQKKEVTVGDALRKPFKTSTGIGTIPRLAKLWTKAKQGERLARVFTRLNGAERGENGRVAGRPGFLHIRLDETKLSPVVLGGPTHHHPTQNRLITVEESAALCGYPRSFVFKGSVGKQYAQVAQAVMPPVGEYLARMVADACRSKRKPTKQPFFEHVEIFADRVDRQLLLPPMSGGSSLEIAKAPQKAVAPAAKESGRQTVASIVAKANAQARVGSGYRIRCLLKEGFSTEYILEKIHKEFPASKAKASDVYWNKRKLEAQGGVP